MKTSKFNYKLKNKGGDLLIMNMLTNKTLKINRQYIQTVDEIFKNGSASDSKDLWIEKILKDKGIIIDNSFDEMKILQLRENKMIYGNDTLSIEIIPTYNCNFRCQYCFECLDNYKMEEFTEKKIIRFLERNIPKCKEFRLSWFGGEPLLCKDTVLKITKAAHKLCKENGIPMYGEISTNGYLLDVETFQQLIKHRILEFQVCIDGTKEIHNTSRPHYENNNSYEMIMANLQNIKENVKSGIFKMNIRANVTPEIENVIEDYLNELSSKFADDNRFYVIFQCVRDWGGERVSQEQIVDSEKEIYKRYYEMSHRKGLNGLTTSRFEPINGNCRACRKNGFIIDPQGNLAKCSLASFSKQYEAINRIGYIKESGNIVVDEEKEAQWIVNKPLREECKKCVLLPLCMGGSQCPYSANIQNATNCNKYILSMIDAHMFEIDDNNQIDTLVSLEYKVERNK